MRPIAATALALVFLTAGAAATGCGGDSGGEVASDAGRPAAAKIAVFKPDLEDADARLRRIYDDASLLLDGGRPAYDKRVAELKGLPIVVNKWGSWCGPCRNEFPLFQRAAKRLGGDVAFLGVNVSDNRQAAYEFLNERPVPYPSYVDRRLRISTLLPPAGAAPSTGFYDADGRLTHVKAGEYKTLSDLETDIRRYATGG